MRPALERARALVQSNNRITVADRERLLGYLEGSGGEHPARAAGAADGGAEGARVSMAARCPSPMATPSALREDPQVVTQKLRAMQTDPARVRRTDPGDPDKCPVWDLHKIYSDEATRQWASAGCRSAGIGCLDCKQPLIDKIVEEVSAHAPPRPGIRGASGAHPRYRRRGRGEGARGCAPDLG